ncbi:site-2 protease family protein [Limisphaera ngatamarikiensis]|uniref:Site-2 protease family protein n=1 Tax=Limisphaera ngatamarikiensis TaxID=1324935 RepID=A0A6M1RUD8_9BACT|nr:site-2 protease family protein [Limisphaera ngatamarikiensis]NGO39004.1 site-2 protease family protein [Limisphaera ngatamarikiensis]
MDVNQLIDGLIFYIGLLVLLTFHEYGHAWMALRCGDDTAKLQGRCSLNPLVHMDPIGTVVLPLLMIFLPGAGQFLVGWARPVPVNPYNLRHPNRDQILVAMAGPAMNVVLAVGLLGLARICELVGFAGLIELLARMAWLSLLLCFFNLIPIPPLDGSYLMRQLTGMSHETYHRIAQYGFLIVILVLQVPVVRRLLTDVTHFSWVMIATVFGLGG